MTINTLLADPKNYNPAKRSISSIRYIVMHYTGNRNDTAKNNAIYFNTTVKKVSAHYFVSEESIWQSVPDDHAAYAVGLGDMKEPYFKYPIMWNKITNSNSISIEMCGSKNSTEASETTKRTAAKLAVELMRKYDLSPSCLYRHYDVTGKQCPAWAVLDPMKWLDIQLLVSNNFYHEGSEEEMVDNPENYSVFKTFMDRYLKELAEKPADWENAVMTWAKERGYLDGTRAKSNVTRGEIAQILYNLENKTR